MTAYQLIDVLVQPPGVVATIKEEFLSTAIAAEFLQNDLQQVISQFRPAVLVVDFAQVKMISSSSIGKLLAIQQRLREYGGQLHLCRVSIPIAEVYRTLGLRDTRLFVFDTVEQALNTRVVEAQADREVMED